MWPRAAPWRERRQVPPNRAPRRPVFAGYDIDHDNETWRWGADCNCNAVLDWKEISDGSSADVNANGVPDECEPCEHVTCLKAACKPRDGRFKVRAALVALLPEGDAFTCTLEGLEPHAVTLNDRGRAKTNWTALIDGEHEVCIEECRDAGVCRHPTCG